MKPLPERPEETLNMAVGEKDRCPSHEQNALVLWCQTCEQLICTRCVSQGPSSTAEHKDHVYLDIVEAYELQREELKGMIDELRERIEGTRSKRQELQSTVNNTKFELLRKRSDVERRARALKDQVHRKEKSLIRDLQQLIQPSLDQQESAYQDADFDLVSREGLISTAQCIYNLPVDKCIQFLRGIKDLNSELRNTLKSCKGSGPSEPKPSQDLQKLKDFQLNLQQQKIQLERAFTFPSHVPYSPQALWAWCVIGSHSASLILKFRKADNVKRFHVYFRQSDGRMTFGRKNSNKGESLDKEGYQLVRIRKFTPGRMQVTLRNLKANTRYTVIVFAVNDVGESEPLCLELRTGGEEYSGSLTRHVRRKWCQFPRNLFYKVVTFGGAIIYVFLLLLLCSTLVQIEVCQDIESRFGTTLFNKVCTPGGALEFSFTKNLGAFPKMPGASNSEVEPVKEQPEKEQNTDQIQEEHGWLRYLF